MTPPKPSAILHDTWHLDKRVPITLVGVLIVQLVYFTTYLKDVQAKVEMNDRRILALESQKVAERLSSLETQMVDNKALLVRMDLKIDRIIEARGIRP